MDTIFSSTQYVIKDGKFVHCSDDNRLHATGLVLFWTFDGETLHAMAVSSDGTEARKSSKSRDTLEGWAKHLLDIGFIG